MSEFELRIQEVFQFIENKDITLGFRKFLDCVMDTQHMAYYEEAVLLTDWKEKNKEKEEELIAKMQLILTKIKDTQVNTYNRNNAVLTATNITKSYGKKKFQLGPVSTTIKKGEVYGLVGENGNGKTTLLRILAKELSYDAGKIDYHFQEEVKTDYDMKSKLVYIPQRTQKWYGSLKDNLKFVLASYNISPKENETRVLMMIARLGLWNYKDLKWSELSSGYKMRFELARTLLRKPELLLLDEPLANLDILAQQVILEDLKAICNSVNNPIALILSSQQLYEVEKISDKVIFLKEGKYKENQNSETTETDNTTLIVEIDCNCERSELQNLFTEGSLLKLTYNGGIYIAEFQKTNFNQVLETLGKHKIEVTYIRNITNSTRRFFVS